MADPPAGAAPRAAYRVQLRDGIDFAAVEALLPYLAGLGVSTLYLSPILAARSGSTHGYDVVDPLTVDRALGGAAGLCRLAEAVHGAGLDILLDIVPNHMAASHENPRWRALLERGRQAPCARWFDVDWEPAGLPFSGRVFLPVLDAPLGEVLQAGRVRLELARDGRIEVVHHGHRLPLRPESVTAILEQAYGGLIDSGADGRELETVCRRWRAADRSGDARQLDEARSSLGRTVTEREAVRRALDAVLAGYDPQAAPGRLFALLRRQHYRVGYWRTGDEKRNYRRFFDIDDLVCVRNEDPAAADAIHRCIRELVEQGVVDGLRIDHIDGLRDPRGYLDWLRRRVGPRYLFVEKILDQHERLPDDWPVDGSTGYEFLNAAIRLFVDPAGFATLRDEAAAATGCGDFADTLWCSKRNVLEWLFSRELDALTALLERLAERDADACDLPRADLRAALAAMSAALPVYRTYMHGGPPGEADVARLRTAQRDAAARQPALRPALAFVCRALRGDVRQPGESSDCELRRLPAVWQLLTGPATAKGLEDTALYRDVSLVALNEVGGEPRLPADPVGAFHELNEHRHHRWPGALNATTTHDTKRSEDVRARIAALSEFPQDWTRTLDRWHRLNAPLRSVAADGPAPDPAMERLLYQTLVGTWPLHEDFDRYAYTDRIHGYAIKAAREAKMRTRWRAVDQVYEKALEAFVHRLLDAGGSAGFLAELDAWAARIAPVGAVTGLAQTLLKCAAPGVPEIYQGSELWDLRLVDPDNRGPVDFDLRRSLLKGLEEPAGRVADPVRLTALRRGWRDGRIKLYTLRRMLAERARDPALFQAGAYVALRARADDAAKAECVCAFARQLESRWALIAVPRLVAPYVRADLLGIEPGAWTGAALALPPNAPGAWRDAFTGRTLECTGRLPVCELFTDFPVAVLFDAR